MYDLTDEQQAVLETVRDFAATAIAPHAAEWDAAGHFPVDELRQAAELGMGGIYVSEDFGGSGLSRRDAALIFEELAKADPTTAAYLSIHNMVVWMVDAFGNEEQRAAWVPELASMAKLGSYCLSEPGVGSDAGALVTKAVRDGDDYVLNGTKQFISGAGVAGYYIVMARTADTGSHGITAIMVPDGVPGLSFGPEEKKMGWHAQPTRQVILRDVRVPVTNRLGAEGDGFGIAMQGLNGGRINIGACSLGGGQAALEKSIAYLKDRVAFGQPLVNQQALLFDLANMDTSLEAARTLLWRAADALDRNAPGKVRLCAMAKLVATDAGFAVANTALQLHGGYGYLTEYGLEKIVRDLRVHQILEGSNEIMRLIVGRLAVAD
ncbi:acyl-CoA dehydrogenase family protein [Specibacter cremeus]|uniref:acyl-CoA dehydrogenase family protein n=1 Tax=Specibacter cremeus TaxID=1629051 RepID=UPI000F7B2ECA|nr:acyl-CoA dehydrogenase family protein [Specibacter cremeus]